MYTAEQHAAQTLENTKEIARLWESTKSAHRRLDDTDRILSGIHELAKNVAAMATEIKLLTDRVDKNIERIEQGQQAQGQRIGNIELAVNQIERNEKELMKHAAKLEAIEKEPADKWKKFTWLIIAGVAAAVVAFIMGKIL